MKPLFTIGALALASALSLNAQAATWSLGDSIATGTRFGIASLNNEGDALFGPVTSDLNDIGPDSVSVGAWDGLTAVNGGNAIDLAVSHEAYAGTSHLGDDATAYVSLLTSAALDNAVIAEDDVVLDAAARAPVKLTQSFVIQAGAGEWVGMQTLVSLHAWAQHNADASGGVDLINQSSFRVWVNDIEVASASKDNLGYNEGSWAFNALIGDTVTLQAINESEFAVGGLALNLGDAPYAHVDGEFGATLNVAAVPEPETWAMLLAGVGLVGLQIRNKSKRITPLKIGA
jgi:hypothetical protein